MKSRIDWKCLLLENKDKTEDALCQAYRQSIERLETSSYSELVYMYENGDIETCVMSPGTALTEVLEGKAIELAHFRWKDPLEGIPESVVLEYLEAEGKLEGFQGWLVAEGYATLEEIEDGTFCAWRMEEYNQELYNEFAESIVSGLADTFDAEGYFFRILEEREG